MTAPLDQIGPVDYLVVEFPSDKLSGDAFAELVALVDRGLIRILDLVFVRKDDEGSLLVLEIADLDGDGDLDLAVFEGVSSGLIGDDEIQEAGGVLAPGTSAGILIFENVWAAPFAAAVRRNGGTLVASGRIPAQDLIDAIATTGSPA